MFGSIALPELAMIVVAGLVSLLIIGYPSARICRRLGLSPLLGLLAIVPVVNLVLLFYVAFASWPAVSREERAVR